jgi:ABC-2 type transport system ATP-binding protein
MKKRSHKAMGREEGIIIKGLYKSFKDSKAFALEDINATMDLGSMVGIVGPDGAGKTTLTRLLIGLLDRDRGQMSVLGIDPTKAPIKLQSLCGYLPQKFGLYEDLTVLENLRLYADLRGLASKERTLKIDKLLDFTNLSNFKDRLAAKLSGGMKQKLGLSAVLIGSPVALFLDEPSVGVDPISRRELWKMVKELCRDGLLVVWATSYLDEAEKCDKVILLNEGKALFVGTPEKAKDRVENRSFDLIGIEYSKKRETLLNLIKDTNVVDGVIKGSYLHVVTKDPNDTNVGKNRIEEMGAIWEKVSPTFEDAFISILGGELKRESALSERTIAKENDNIVTVEANKLNKHFGNFVAVKDISFRIKRGEIFGLLGPNGAGKSTTFKMLCGLLVPSSGKITIMGYDLKKEGFKAKKHLGYMAQKFSLYDQLSVEQNLKFFSGAYGLYGKIQKEEISLMQKIFALTPYLKTNASELPLGFKQRLALASAVMHQPDILFLDEPTSGVDPVTRREFWLHINYLATMGVTILVTTHFMDEAEYCDRVALIYRGENIAQGTPDDLKTKVKSKDLENPTLEDAFVGLVTQYEA